MTDTATKPLILDGIEFVPLGGDAENAYRDGVLVGEFTPDDVTRAWRARKPGADGVMGDWKPMRSAAEARAFIVSSRP